MKYLLVLAGMFWGLIVTAQQFTNLPVNRYGKATVQTLRQYRELVKADSSQVLVNLSDAVPHLKISMPYTTNQNFTQQVLYPQAAAFLKKEAAQALKIAAEALAKKGLGILLYDAYRPFSVTEKMWQIVPNEDYAANPANGSGHNRGAAVDVGLYYLHNGAAVPMPTLFDNFTDTAHVNFMPLPAEILNNRATLIQAMEQAGFKVLPTEWWHFSLPEAAKKYPLHNLSFAQLLRSHKKG
jgi:zinc D-Ala-D-Ala dipeptidase